MANQGEFTGGSGGSGVTRVSSLPPAAVGLVGQVFYMTATDGSYLAHHHYAVKYTGSAYEWVETYPDLSDLYTEVMTNKGLNTVWACAGAYSNGTAGFMLQESYNNTDIVKDYIGTPVTGSHTIAATDIFSFLTSIGDYLDTGINGTTLGQYINTLDNKIGTDADWVGTSIAQQLIHGQDYAGTVGITTAHGALNRLTDFASTIEGDWTTLVSDADAAHYLALDVKNSIAFSGSLVGAGSLGTGLEFVYDRIGSPVGASISADIAAISSAVSTLSPDPTAFKAAKTTGSLTPGGTASATLDLTVADGFDCQNAEIKHVKVVRTTGASSKFTVSIYEKSDLSSDNLLATYETTAGDLNESAVLMFINNDSTPGKHCYVRVTNNTDVGSSTFTATLRGIRLATALA